MNHILCFFTLLFLNLSLVSAQSTKICKFSDVKIYSNLDSLEKSKPASSVNPNQLFLAIATLEKTRLKLSSCRFGEDLKRLDSLAKIVKTDAAFEISLALGAFYKINNFESKKDIINDLNRVIILSEKTKDTVALANTLCRLIVENLIGEVYVDAPLTSSSKLLVKNYYDKVISVTQNSTNPALKLIECNAKVEYFLNVDTSCEMVLKSANEGLKIIDTYIEDINTKNYFYTCLSACYNYNKDFEKGLFYSKKCLSLPRAECSTILGHNLFSIANCYYELDQKDSALKYYSQAIEAINNTKPINLLLLEYCYDRVSVIKYYKENYQQAFEDLYVRDSLFAIRTQKEKNNLSITLQHKYEFENNLQKIAILKKEKKEYTIALIVGLIVCLLITALLVYNHKMNKKLKQLVNFRDKVHAIISHDLRSPFLSLQGLNSEASYLIRKGKFDNLLELASGIDEASSKISNLLNNLLHWASADKIKSSKKSTINLEEVFTKTINLYSSIVDQKHIAITKNFEQLELIVANRNVLELILRNWLDNTLKHSNASEIKIVALYVDGYYKILISDNGSINDNTVTMIQNQLQNNSSIMIESDTGLGLELISYFSKIENWKIDFVSNGINEFSIRIPISKLL